jgi:Protein of unknown function (DUF3515)
VPPGDVGRGRATTTVPGRLTREVDRHLDPYGATRRATRPIPRDTAHGDDQRGRARRRPAVAVGALGLLGSIAVGGCSGGAPRVALAPPTPGPSAAEPCQRLHDALPDTVGDVHRARDVTPASPYTAAWGDPPIELSCGARPPNRPLTGDELTVDQVTWLGSQQGDVVTWRTLGRAVTVQLDVPNDYDDQDAVLADVSARVARTVPRAASR